LFINTLERESVSLKVSPKQFLQRFPGDAGMATQGSLLYVIKILEDGMYIV